MLVHLLGLLDTAGALTIVLGHFGLVHYALLYVALYFIIKVIFFRDVLSWIDTAAGIYAVFLFFGAASALTWLFAIYFFYKMSIWVFYSLSH